MTDTTHWTGFATVVIRIDRFADGGAEAKYEMEDALESMVGDIEGKYSGVKDARVEQLDVKKLQDN
jgi:Mg2+/Co2+ transporter CorC